MSWPASLILLLSIIDGSKNVLGKESVFRSILTCWKGMAMAKHPYFNAQHVLVITDIF